MRGRAGSNALAPAEHRSRSRVSSRTKPGNGRQATVPAGMLSAKDANSSDATRAMRVLTISI